MTERDGVGVKEGSGSVTNATVLDIVEGDNWSLAAVWQSQLKWVGCKPTL